MKKLLLLLPLLSLSLCAQVQLQNATLNNFQVTSTATQQQGTPVDLLFQWTGTQGLLTTNIVKASQIGSDKGTISYTYADFTHVILTNSSFTRAPFNVGGTLYSNFSQSLDFNQDIATAHEGFTWVPGQNHTNFSATMVFRPNLSGTAANRDFIVIGGGTFSVVEFIVDSGGSGYLVAHGDNGATTKVAATDRLTNNRDYSITLRHNVTAKRVEVMVIDSAGGFLVGSGYAASSIAGPIASIQFKDYLWASGTTGNYYARFLAFDWSNAAMPLEPMPTVLPVTNLVSSQAATNEIDVSWGYQARSDWTLEKNDGTNWSTVWTTNLNSYTDTQNLVIGATYTYRVTANAFQYSSTATTSTPLTLVNAGWHDNIEPADTDTDNVSDNGIVVYGKVHLSTGGTATKIRTWDAEQQGPSNVKLALFDSSKALVATGAVVSTVPDFSSLWLESSITPTFLSSGDYYIGFVCDNNSAPQKWRYKSSGGFRLYKFQAYAAFPSNPIGEDGSQALDMPVGILTQ